MMGKPKIRFKGYNEDWEQRKLGEMGSTFTGLSGKNKEDFGHGEAKFITYMNVFSNPVANLEMTESVEIDTKQNSVKKGDVFFTTSSEIPEEVGMSCVMPENKENIYLNSFCFGYRPTEKFDLDYLAYVLRTASFRKEMTFLAQGISRYNISKNKVMEVSIPVPNLEEQVMIGGYFSNLDHLITLHQHKCDEMKKLKKCMLQKMFPQNGKKVPEIRFEGFTNDWEQRKFGELAEYKKGPFGSAITKSMFVPKSDDSVKVYEQQNAINKDWSLERYFLPKEYAYTRLKAFEVHSGDIIVSCAGTIGEIYEIPDNAEYGVINQALMRVRVNEKIVDKRMFIIAFSNMINEFTRTHSNGSAIKNIPPFADLKPMKVLMPSMEEQRVISEYFEKIDNLITLHQHKCDELQNLKKYMLQNMFV